MAAYKTALHIDSSQVDFCCLLKFWSLISTSSPIYLSVFTCMQYECVIISFPNEKLNFIVGIVMDNLIFFMFQELFIFTEHLQLDFMQEHGFLALLSKNV